MMQLIIESESMTDLNMSVEESDKTQINGIVFDAKKESITESSKKSAQAIKEITAQSVQNDEESQMIDNTFESSDSSKLEKEISLKTVVKSDSHEINNTKNTNGLDQNEVGNIPRNINEEIESNSQQKQDLLSKAVDIEANIEHSVSTNPDETQALVHEKLAGLSENSFIPSPSNKNSCDLEKELEQAAEAEEEITVEKPVVLETDLSHNKTEPSAMKIETVSENNIDMESPVNVECDNTKNIIDLKGATPIESEPKIEEALNKHQNLTSEEKILAPESIECNMNKEIFVESNDNDHNSDVNRSTNMECDDTSNTTDLKETIHSESAPNVEVTDNKPQQTFTTNVTSASESIECNIEEGVVSEIDNSAQNIDLNIPVNMECDDIKDSIELKEDLSTDRIPKIEDVNNKSQQTLVINKNSDSENIECNIQNEIISDKDFCVKNEESLKEELIDKKEPESDGTVVTDNIESQNNCVENATVTSRNHQTTETNEDSTSLMEIDDDELLSKKVLSEKENVAEMEICATSDENIIEIIDQDESLDLNQVESKIDSPKVAEEPKVETEIKKDVVNIEILDDDDVLTEQNSIENEKTLDKEKTPEKEKSPENDKIPLKEKTPENENTPKKEQTPEKEIPLENEKTPEKEEISEKEKTPVKQKTPEKEKTPEKGISKSIVMSKLSNLLDILSEDEEETTANAKLEDKPQEPENSINLDDDDDVMLIEDIKETPKESSTSDKVNELETPNEMEAKVVQPIVDINDETGEKEAKKLEEPIPAIEKEPEHIVDQPKISEKEPVSSLPEIKSKKPLLPLNFLKSAKKNLSDMTRDELEEFCIMKIVEGIVDRSSLADIKTKMKSLETNMEEYKKKAVALSKQNRDLQVVLKSVQEEQKNRQNSAITPLKITRSVGMQVLMVDKAKKKPLPQTINVNSTKPVLRGPKSQRKIPTAPTAPNIPVPRLVPASPAKTPNSPTIVPKTPIPIPNINGVKNTSPAQKVPEKRPMSRQSSLSMTVDLTDDEPPAKVSKTGSPGPVRLVPPQNLVVPRSPMLNNDTRKVYIPISGTQARNIRPGQTVLLKNMPTSVAVPQQRMPTLTRVPQPAHLRPRTNVRLRHPAPLPDAMKQYQPPTWKGLPPAPDLKLTKVENGIVISWKIEGYQEESYEKIASYQLYAYQETNTPPNTALWKKIGDVKALPLPMACTLTQFMAGFKYYFAVRAVDVKSRLGPFSLPGSILLLNKM